VKITKKIRETLLDPREKQRREVRGIRKYITREKKIMEIDNVLHVEWK